jgi:hypothetical protein
MKKVLVSLLLISAIFKINAQEIKYGIRVGINNSNFNGSFSSEDWSSKFGFHLGGFVEFKISNTFSVQPELDFSSQGANYEYSSSNINYTYNESGKYKLDYINLPILAKFYVVEDVSILAGPQIGILIRSDNPYSVTENSNGFSDTYSDNRDINDLLKSTSINFSFGLNYKINESFFLDTRYNLGVSNIAEDYDVKNSVLQLSVGYLFK